MKKIYYCLVVLSTVAIILSLFSKEKTHAAIAPIVAFSQVPCFNDPPTWLPHCGECIDGVGRTLDNDCVENAKAAWRICADAACDRHQARCDAARDIRNAAWDAAMKEALECLSLAQTEAEQDVCIAAATKTIEDADQELNLSIQASNIVYLGDIFACDSDYLSAVEHCCRDCDPWEGW